MMRSQADPGQPAGDTEYFSEKDSTEPKLKGIDTLLAQDCRTELRRREPAGSAPAELGETA